MFRKLMIVLAGVLVILLAINLPVSPLLKFVVGIIGMYIISTFLSAELKIKQDWGLMMVRSQSGVQIIQKIAKYAEFWKLFSDVATAMGYGVFSLFMIKRPLKERVPIAVFGMILVFALFAYAMPFVSPFIIDMVGGSKITSGANQVQINPDLVKFAISFFGLAFMGLVSLLGYSYVIISKIIGSVFYGQGHLSSITPGATLVLPGVNIPFFEGILALAFILVVHEGAHAVLSCIAKVRILSTGIVLFGIIPIGAFVEPDEERLQKESVEKQTRVLVAGSGANLMSALVLFIMLILFMRTTYSQLGGDVFVPYGPLNGTRIEKINNQDPITFLKANDVSNGTALMLSTDKGEKNVVIGKDVKYSELENGMAIFSYANPVFNFIYRFLGLAFVLNFIVGVINLLPLPFFDGYRIVEVNVKNKHMIKALMYITAAAFLMNFVPWLF